MVEATVPERAAIEAELYALVEKHLAAYDSYTELINDPAKGHFVRYTTVDNNRLTIAKYRATGLTKEMILGFYSNLIENAPKINKTYQVSKLNQEQGYQIWHNLAKAPWPVTNRSTIYAEYSREKDGAMQWLFSSKGCDHLIAPNAKLIGKNVVARSIVLSESYQPFEGGYDITCVTCIDPSGSLPQFMKDWNCGMHASAPVTIANLLLHGIVSKD